MLALILQTLQSPLEEGFPHTEHGTECLSDEWAYLEMTSRLDLRRTFLIPGWFASIMLR